MIPVGKMNKKYQVMFHDVGFTKKLKLSAVFNYFQEIAGLHADNLGIGISTIEEKYGVAWVLVRMRVDITRYPVWDEEIIVETWPQIPGKLEFERDYIIRDLKGNIIARAASVWVIIDIKTRRLKKADVIAIDYPEMPTERAIGSSLGKLEPFGIPQLAYKRTIGCSDIDINAHLNNSKYIDFIMDCFSMEDLKKYSASSIQVNYLNEALPGDTIMLFKDTTEINTGRIYIKGVNEKNSSMIFESQISIVEIK